MAKYFCLRALRLSPWTKEFQTQKKPTALHRLWAYDFTANSNPLHQIQALFMAFLLPFFLKPDPLFPPLGLKRSTGDVIHMADASSMAPRFARRIPANCMAHARRYFIEAYTAFPEHCDRVLDDMASIYRYDDDTRGMDPDARLAYHQQHSRLVMDRLYERIERQFHERIVEPNSRLGKAFSYVKNHWDL